MGFMDEAKKTAEAVGEKLKDAWDDMTDRTPDADDDRKDDAKGVRNDTTSSVAHEADDAGVADAEAQLSQAEARDEIRKDLRD